MLSERFVQAALVLVGVIHVVPAIGVAGASRLTALYGIDFDGTDLLILMRHRAVMLGIVGLLMFAGAVRKAVRIVALAAGWISVGSFLALGSLSDSYNSAVGRVITIDIPALVLLLGATLVQVGKRDEGRNAGDKVEASERD